MELSPLLIIYFNLSKADFDEGPYFVILGSYRESWAFLDTALFVAD